MILTVISEASLLYKQELGALIKYPVTLPDDIKLPSVCMAPFQRNGAPGCISKSLRNQAPHLLPRSDFLSCCTSKVLTGPSFLSEIAIASI